MFEIRNDFSHQYYIYDGGFYLHSDGHHSVCREYWPTQELAQAVLDKWQPKHVWVHGDVCKHGDTIMIYLTPESGLKLYSVSCKCSGLCQPKLYLKDATFLFNIKDKL